MPVRLFMTFLLGFLLMGQDRPSPSWRIAEVSPDHDLLLEDGRVIKLANVQIPPLPSGKIALTWLRENSLGLKIEALPEEVFEPDRHGRLVFQIRLENDFWLQEEMLRAGHARLDPIGLSDEFLESLRAAEQSARIAGRGIWQNPLYRIKKPETLDRSHGRYEIVRGKVWNAAALRDVIYLNFSEDWREDFTVRIDRRNRKAFQGVLQKMESLTGQNIEVRGWVRYYNGPMIDVFHSHQIMYIGEGEGMMTRREIDGDQQ